MPKYLDVLTAKRSCGLSPPVTTLVSRGSPVFEGIGISGLVVDFTVTGLRGPLARPPSVIALRWCPCGERLVLWPACEACRLSGRS